MQTHTHRLTAFDWLHYFFS